MTTLKLEQKWVISTTTTGPSPDHDTARLGVRYISIHPSKVPAIHHGGPFRDFDDSGGN